MTRKILSLLFCLLFLPSLCLANYSVTEVELIELESILTQLTSNNSQLLIDLKESKVDLVKALKQLEQSQQELTKLQTQLIQLRTDSQQAKLDLMRAQNLLHEANKSLEQYEKEVKKTQSRLKRQRTIAYVLASGVIVYAASK